MKSVSSNKLLVKTLFLSFLDILLLKNEPIIENQISNEKPFSGHLKFESISGQSISDTYIFLWVN